MISQSFLHLGLAEKDNIFITGVPWLLVNWRDIYIIVSPTDQLSTEDNAESWPMWIRTLDCSQLLERVAHSTSQPQLIIGLYCILIYYTMMLMLIPIKTVCPPVSSVCLVILIVMTEITLIRAGAGNIVHCSWQVWNNNFRGKCFFKDLILQVFFQLSKRNLHLKKSISAFACRDTNFAVKAW